MDQGFCYVSHCPKLKNFSGVKKMLSFPTHNNDFVVAFICITRKNYFPDMT